MAEIILNNDCPVDNDSGIDWPWGPEHAENRTDTDVCYVSPEIAALSKSVSALSMYYRDRLKIFFSNPNNVVATGLRNSIANKSVYVTDMSEWSSEDTSKYPRAVVSFEGKKKQNNFAFNNQISYDIRNGSREYYEVFHISHAIHAQATTKIEAEDLGDIICAFFSAFQGQIAKDINSHKFQVLEMTKAQAVQVSDTSAVSYICTVGLQHTTPDSWVVFEASPVLKRINPDINTFPTQR